MKLLLLTIRGGSHFLVFGKEEVIILSTSVVCIGILRNRKQWWQYLGAQGLVLVGCRFIGNREEVYMMFEGCETTFVL